MSAALALIERLKLEVKAIKPLSEQIIDWVEARKKVWRLKTYQSCRSRIDCFLAWVGKRQITNDLVKLFFQDLLERRHRTTYRAYRQALRAVCKGIDRMDLMEGVEQVKTTKTPAKYFQRHQIARLKNHLLNHDLELWLFCQFLYYCFIRPGELRMLRIGDILFDDWKICVRAEVSKNKKQQYVTIPLAFRKDLECLMTRLPNEYTFYKLDATKPVAMNYMTRRFRKILNELGFGNQLSERGVV